MVVLPGAGPTPLLPITGQPERVTVEPAGREGDLNFTDAFNYHIQIATAATENAFRRG
jgi:hypothetical protein